MGTRNIGIAVDCPPRPTSRPTPTPTRFLPAAAAQLLWNPLVAEPLQFLEDFVMKAKKAQVLTAQEDESFKCAVCLIALNEVEGQLQEVCARLGLCRCDVGGVCGRGLQIGIVGVMSVVSVMPVREVCVLGCRWCLWCR